MEFNQKQMSAILKAAKLMALADGKMTSEEKEIMKIDLESFGIKLDTMESLLIEQVADNLEGTEVISILSNLTNEQKKYVCGYLATIMQSDGKIEEVEHKLWVFFSSLANFPTMNIIEAISYWQNH